MKTSLNDKMKKICRDVRWGMFCVMEKFLLLNDYFSGISGITMQNKDEGQKSNQMGPRTSEKGQFVRMIRRI